MTNHTNKQDQSARAETREHLPSAKIKKGHLSSLLWLVPLGAACLCGWFVYRDVIATGPTIAIIFDNVDGLEEKNTQVKFRGANVGEIRSIELMKDNKHVKVVAQLTGIAKDLARSGSMFWIVRPDLKIGSATGLRTIISGEYVTLRPGDGPPTNSFVGSDKPPITERSNTLQINLVSSSLGSVQEQTPIFYRGIQVGEVLYYQLADDSREVIMRAGIWQEYAPLVRAETKFWNAGGLSIHAGLFKGVEISAESPKTIISGGIEFATPPESQLAATNGTTYLLNEKPDEKWKSWAPEIPLHLSPQANQGKQTNKSPELYLK